MSLSNISILQTSNSAVITHPSKICSVLVDEVDSEPPKIEDKKSKIKIPGRKPTTRKKKEEQVDIITDAD